MTGAEHYSIPKELGGRGALVLALVVHLALLAFLWIGVSWQSQDQGGVEAEVWDTQYREAAPKQPEPVAEEKPIIKPEPKPVEKLVERPVEKAQVAKAQVAKADIALEQEKKRKEDAKKKTEEDKRKKSEADKKKKEIEDKRKLELADQKRSQKLRDEEMRRMTALAGTGGSGTAPRSTGNNRGDPGYGNLVGAKIRSNTAFVVPGNLDGNPSVEYAIELLPDGYLRATPRKRKSSGVPGFDEAVLKAIKKSEPFPKDSTGKVPSSFILIHKPKG